MKFLNNPKGDKIMAHKRVIVECFLYVRQVAITTTENK
jgi:hypothetical protein